MNLIDNNDFSKPGVVALFRALKVIAEKIPVDFGGGSPLSKTVLMAYLASEYSLRTYVEIGVYRGRSFFPMAQAMRMIGGKSYGIDPYENELAKEFDLEEEKLQQVNSFIDSIDFPQLFNDVSKFRADMEFSESCELLRQQSAMAADIFREKKIAIDMLHIDGNHDEKNVIQDVNLYLPLVSEGGFLVMDDIDWDSVKPAFELLKETCTCIFTEENYAILIKGKSQKDISQTDIYRFKNISNMVENFEKAQILNGLPEIDQWATQSKVSVILISYNQEKYIEDCLAGILAQKGDFKLELVVGDDASIDNTNQIITNYINLIPKTPQIEIIFLPVDIHYGLTKNFKRCLDAVTGDYFAVCEGDDFWIDNHKIQKQVDFLKEHPNYSMCFNDLFVLWQNSGVLEPAKIQVDNEKDFLTTRELVGDYTIGNITTCMYDSRYLHMIPVSLFDLVIGDWMFNIYYSQFGNIGRNKEKMSVYRKHSKGYWSSRNLLDNPEDLFNIVKDYNKFLNYKYDAEFSQTLDAYESAGLIKQPAELGIIDDFFPHPLSAFRMEEFMGYLRAIPNLKIYSTGTTTGFFDKTPISEFFAGFRMKYPEFALKVKRYFPNNIQDIKVLYTIFLNNAFYFISDAEKLKIPFVFTLYPGGGFALDNWNSDQMLTRVTSSPCFRKVIVTQKITSDYLINKGFCSPNQIEFIYGGVIPQDNVNQEVINKEYFGKQKNVLDICFVAHNYIEKGRFKGYDVFIEVAHQLVRKYKNINFHVVGGFDKTDFDVTEIEDRVTFYGTRSSEWFDEFYKDKDIILSPNIPVTGMEYYNGTFDGFPTGGCIEAGLRKVAIFCTDELQLNLGYFSEGEEIVIIPHDAARITGIIENYYHNPDKLILIAEHGSLKLKHLFSYEYQMAPRIKLFLNEIKENERNSAIIRLKMIDWRYKYKKYFSGESILQNLKKIIPPGLKRFVKKIIRNIRSNSALFSLLKRITPKFIKRVYHHIVERIR